MLATGSNCDSQMEMAVLSQFRENTLHVSSLKDQGICLEESHVQPVKSKNMYYYYVCQVILLH